MALKISPKKQLLLFFCWLAVFFFITLVVSAVLVMTQGETTTTTLLATICQDLFIFILPVVVTLIMVGRNPLEYVWLNKRTTLGVMLLTIALVVVQFPTMNAIIKLNTLIPLPEWMASNEEITEKAIERMFGDYSSTYFMIGIIVVGFLAAFSEEFLFRGFLTRMLSTRFGAHATIWIVAAIFSFVHFQFAGFVPRMLLGALFGYMALWSGTLWTAILAHFVNNTLAICGMFLTHKNGFSELNDLGAGLSAIDVCAVVISVAVFVVLIHYYRRLALQSNRAYAGDVTNG